MKILIVGSGMYVTGRNETGIGTILASIVQFSKHVETKLTVVSQHFRSKKYVDQTMQRINQKLGTNLVASFSALGSNYQASFEEFLKLNQFDSAIISVPDHLHFIYCYSTLNHEIPTLVVKPLTPTLDEALKLVEIASKKNVYGMVEFHKRWDQSNLLAKVKIGDGDIGEILYSEVNYSQKITVPTEIFKGWSEKTDIFQYLGIHYVDLIYFLTGYLPFKLNAYGQNGILKKLGINTYDSIHASIIWQSQTNEHNFYSHFNINWIDPKETTAMSDQKMKIVGTNGRIELDQKNRGIEIVNDQGVQHPNPYFSEFLIDKNSKLFFQGYAYESIKTFLEDVSDLKLKTVKLSHLEKYRPSFRSSIVSTAVIEKVRESIKQNSKWIHLDQTLWRNI